MASAFPTRLEVRLDEEHRRKLGDIAEERHAPISEVVRQLIDQAYEEVDVARRKAALERMLSGEPMPVPDDPHELQEWYVRTKYAAVDERLGWKNGLPE
jgi:predicted transcriptional regulator